MPNWVAWIGLGLGVASSIFWAGVYFGSLRGQLARLKTDVRDLKRAYEKVGGRAFVGRFPDEGEPPSPAS